MLAQARWSHLKTNQVLLMDISQALETSHSKSSLDSFQYQYLPELLVNVYRYHLIMVKTVSYCYVHESWLLSNPVTFLHEEM